MEKVYPILLAGGSGTRLWPLSRQSYPKQFSNNWQQNIVSRPALRLTSSEQIEFCLCNPYQP